MSKKSELKKVALLLETTMCNAGYMDDYDEVIDEAYGGGKKEGDELHDSTITGLKFINEHAGNDEPYDLKPFNDDRDNALEDLAL